MAVFPGLEGLLKNEVAVGVVGDHHILVAGAFPDKETPCVLSKELAEGVDLDEDLIRRCLHCCMGVNERRRGWQDIQLGLGQPDILALLGEVSQDCLVRVRIVSSHIGIGEALKCVAVTSLDGIEPCLLGREAKTCMIESNLGANAGEVHAAGVKCGAGHTWAGAGRAGG